MTPMLQDAVEGIWSNADDISTMGLVGTLETVDRHIFETAEKGQWRGVHHHTDRF